MTSRWIDTGRMDRKNKPDSSKRDIFLRRLGSHIAEVRREKGYSQDRLYLEASFSRGTVSKIERGLVNPQIWTLHIIAKTIGVPLRRLVTFKKKSI